MPHATEQTETPSLGAPPSTPLITEKVENREIGLETPPFTRQSPDLPKIDQPIADELRLIREQIDALGAATERRDEIIKSLHDELQTYKNGIRREYIYPILKEIIRWAGRVSDTHSHYVREIKRDPAEAVRHIPNLLKEYRNLEYGLMDLIDDHGIATVKPVPGEKFDPLKHKRIGSEETEDPAKDGAVAGFASVGFADLETGRLLKQAEVIVFVLKSQASQA